jgi:hypothetical protein
MLLFAQLLADANNDTGAVGSLLGLGCLGFIALLIYFLPFFVAAMRGHQNTAAIFVLNFFLGWSFIGWVIALVWSFTEVRKAD